MAKAKKRRGPKPYKAEMERLRKENIQLRDDLVSRVQAHRELNAENMALMCLAEILGEISLLHHPNPFDILRITKEKMHPQDLQSDTVREIFTGLALTAVDRELGPHSSAEPKHSVILKRMKESLDKYIAVVDRKQS